MKLTTSIFLVLIFTVLAMPQTAIQTLVATEHAFADLAEERGTRTAFLANMSDDALIFNPDRVNAKGVWTARGESPSLLSWAPNYADVSSNGIFGYTTGNWEYRAKGKADVPAAFGEFITVWIRQPEGKYKFVIDIGVSHAKPEKYSSEWSTSSIAEKDANTKNSNAADIANGFYSIMADDGLKKAYEAYAADDIRGYREEMKPIIGKKRVLALMSSDKANYAFAKRSTFFGSADLSYNLNTYTKTVGGKVVETGNTMQIWKLVRGKWRIVLDIFKPVPQK